jgi:outer membrane cobalamin receptor
MRPLAVCVLSVLSLAAPFRAHAEGSLSGSARTVGGTPLPQIVLLLEGPAGPRTVVTGPEGRYHVDALPPGDYRLTPRAPGLVLQQEASVHVDGETRLDVVVAAAPVREHVVVSATRGEATLSTLGVSVTVLDGEAIAAREPTDFVHLLQDVPGMAVARAGGVGLQASAFVRGGASNFARVLVDGVPINEPGGAVNFGSQLPLELDRVEVVRGAASSLYGTDALAGVIHLVTRTADPNVPLSFRAEGEGGSFSWGRFQGGASGHTGAVDWNAGLARLDTDNEQPNSAFGETAGALSVGVRLGDRSTLRIAARGETSSVGTPGPTAFVPPDLDASYEWKSLVAGATWRQTVDRASHEIHAGVAATDRLSLDPLDSGCALPEGGGRTAPFERCDFPNPGFQNDTRRLSAGYQAELQLGRANLVTVGTDLEHETGEVGQRPDGLLTPSRTNVGVYGQDRFVWGGRAFLTVGGRVEHNASFGTKAVPRVALAFRLRDGASATTLKASAGAGIKEPDFFQSFGASSFAKGNPDLKPESSRTYDVGIEQRLAHDRLDIEATFFHHDYRDQIAYHVVDPSPDNFQATYVNLGKERARGVELSIEAAPWRRVHLGGQYSWLDGKVLVSSSDFDPVYAAGQPLLRRPRNEGSLWFRAEAGRLSLGANLVMVGERADSDFLGLGLGQNAAYNRVDARARLRVAKGFEAFVASENLFDSQYQELLGYPALGRSVRGGVRFATGGSRP